MELTKYEITCPVECGWRTVESESLDGAIRHYVQETGVDMFRYRVYDVTVKGHGSFLIEFGVYAKEVTKNGW